MILFVDVAHFLQIIHTLGAGLRELAPREPLGLPERSLLRGWLSPIISSKDCSRTPDIDNLS